VATPVVETFTSAGISTSGFSTIDLTKPAGVVADDLLLLIVGNDPFPGNATFNNIAGWTRFVNNSGSAGLGAFWRIADGTEPATVTVSMTDTTEVWGFYIRISGADTTAPINVQGVVQNSGNSTSFVVDQVTTTVGDCLAFYALAFDGGGGAPFSVSGTGWTESAEIAAGTGAGDASGTWGTKSIPLAGATGDATVTTSASDGAAHLQFAIAPAPPGGLDLNATLFVDPDSFGGGTLVLGTPALNATLFVDPDSFGAATVIPGPIDLTGPVFIDPDSFGAATVMMGPTDLAGTLFVDPDAFGGGTVELTTFNQSLTATLFVDLDSFGGGEVVIPGQVPALALEYLYPLRDFPGDAREHRRKLAESTLRLIQNTQQVQDAVNDLNTNQVVLQGNVNRRRWAYAPLMDLTNGGANDLSERMLVDNLPASVTDIEILLFAGSTTLADRPIEIQVGDGSIWKTTGYQAGMWGIDGTAPDESGQSTALPFRLRIGIAATEAIVGKMSLCRFGESSARWMVEASATVVAAPFATGIGIKQGGATATFEIADLTRVRAIVSQAGGAATMDSGEIVLRYRPGA
jgi:hypothetical protein